LARFGLLSAVLVSALGIGTGITLGNTIRERAIENTVRTGQVLTEAGIRPFITPEDLATNFVPLSSVRRSELDNTIGSSLSSNGIVRLKLWNKDHWVVYSDKEVLRGRWFPADPALNAALAGNVNSSISGLSKAEEMEERDFGQLLNVYVPLRVDDAGAFTSEPTGKVVGAFEIYLPYKPIAASIAADTKRLYMGLGVGLIALYLGLFQLMRSASQRLRKQAQQNHHQARHDGLTDLPNRVLFLDQTTQAIEAATKTGTVTSVLLLDVDRFKAINDSLGHQRGDQLLVMIGKRIKDRFSAATCVARLGGDEFAILLTEQPSPAAAPVAAEELLALFAEPFDVGSVAVDARISIGIASCPTHGTDADTLLRQADVAMYSAKAQHCGFEVYSDSIDQYKPEHLELLGDVRRAIGANEFVLYYQPKLDLLTNRVVGCEALVRWIHFEKGLMGPGQFMPVIESTELIKPLTLHLVDQAMKFSRDLRAAGFPISIAVNVAARTTVDTKFPGQIADIVKRHGVPFEALELELTESAVLDNPKRAQQVLGELAKLGIAISVDDFGTGYASISYLTQLPISTLKIDQSFIKDVLTNEKSEAVVTFSVALADSLHLKVVAEGIEELPILDRLRELGCDQAQGYYIAKPMPADAFMKFLIDQAIYAVNGTDQQVIDQPQADPSLPPTPREVHA
jgi:diguanylate cyclase (GGDEF)-like protein